jgi:hypothetical protein
MKSIARNTFVVEIDAHLPDNEELRAVQRWLNLQHAGKELIPLSEKCSEAHKEAAWHLHACHRMRLKFRINKQGHWKFIKML